MPAEDLVAGVDEVGRGPLAGPVVAAAVILDPRAPIAGLCDSKQLKHGQRWRIARDVRERALAWSLGRADVGEIDVLNILQATMLAMRRAVLTLETSPWRVLVDGNRCPELSMGTQAIVGGDARIDAISAASILAKVARDEEMGELDRRYPKYGFARHKGYATAEHLRCLRRFGATPVHRRSFRPVEEVLALADCARHSGQLSLALSGSGP